MSEIEQHIPPLSHEGIDVSEVPDSPRLGMEDRVFAKSVLEEAIETMTDQEKRCLLPMLGGYGIAEIAQRLELPQPAVKTFLENAFAKIRTVARGHKAEE